MELRSFLEDGHVAVLGFDVIVQNLSGQAPS